MRRMPSVLAAVTLLALSATTARADLKFDHPTVDVGEVRSGAPLKQRFAFVNDGPGTIEIISVRPGCGCVSSSLEKSTCSAGESGAVVLEVRTLSQSPGEHTWRQRVTYLAGACFT